MSEQKKGNELKSIGKRVQALRMALGMTQEQLSEKLFVSREWVNKIERGAGDMKTGSIIALAEALHTTCDYLLLGVQSANVDIFRETGLEDASIEALKRYKRQVEISVEKYASHRAKVKEFKEAHPNGIETIVDQLSFDEDYRQIRNDHISFMLALHFCNKFIQNEELLKQFYRWADNFWDSIGFADRDFLTGGARFSLSKRFDNFLFQVFDNCENMRNI